MNYDSITSLDLQCTCVTCGGIDQWEELMKGAVRADKRKINRLVKRLLPDLYDNLVLDFHNPYNYYRTEKHLVLVHSAIEYFITYS